MPELVVLLRLLLAGVAAYLIGSFPTGVLLGHTWAGVDPRFAGSFHTGGLNMLRVTGRPWLALITMLVDASKGLIAVAIGNWLAPTPWALPVAGVMVTVGHCWPLYARFRGGMGLSTLGVILLFIQPGVILIVAALWFVLYRAMRHSARAVVLALIPVGPILWLLDASGPVFTLGLVGSLVLFLRHSRDWHRVYKGEQHE